MKEIIGNGIDNTFNDLFITGLSGNIITTESIKTSIEEIDSSIFDILISGVCNWGGAGNYYSVAGTTFTLLRSGDGRIKGKNITWVGNQNITLVANACNYIYINSSGTLAVTQVDGLSVYTDNILLFEALYDGTNIFVVKEDHTCNMQAVTSFVFHNTIGTVITTSTNNQNIGANITRVATGGGGAVGDRQLKIVGEAYLMDHGLITTIPDSSSAAININWYYTNASGHWVRFAQQTEAPMYYNNAGTPTLLTAGRYANFRIYVSKDDLNSVTPTYFAVMGTVQHLNSAQALAAVNAGTVASYTNELYQLELAQLGFITVDNSGGGFISRVLINKKTTVSGITTGTGSALASGVNTNVTNFNKLLSATDTTVQAALETLDEHGVIAGTGITYGHLNDQSQIIAGAKTFSNRVAITGSGALLNIGTATNLATPAITLVSENSGYAAPSNTDAISIGDKWVFWNQSGYKGAIGFEARTMWFQSTEGTVTDNNRFKFYAGSVGVPVEILTLGDGAIGFKWNATGIDLDFNIAAAGAANALHVDGATGKIGIGAVPLTNMIVGDILLEGGSLVLKEISTPTADANYGKVYTKNDNKIYFQDGAGSEHEISLVP